MTFEQELFVYWVNARYDIYCRKEAGEPKPWSDDPIFQTTYFTNVKREQDKTTKYIRNEWVGDTSSSHMDMLVTALVFARMVNRIETLREVAWSHTPLEEWVSTLKNMRNKGSQIFSGAYLITTCGVKMDKLDYVYRVCSDVYRQDWSVDWQRETTHPNTCEYWHRRLERVNGLGSFLAAQVIADLKNTIGHPLANAEDWWTFVAKGPGSVRGLNYFWGRLPEVHMSDQTFKDLLNKAKLLVQDEISEVPKLCNQDLQNCFCEYSKYMRVRAGGRTKRNYGGK